MVIAHCALRAQMFGNDFCHLAGRIVLYSVKQYDRGTVAEASVESIDDGGLW